MTKYEELMNKSDVCCLKAIEFARKGDWNMATFWKKASIGYKEKSMEFAIYKDLEERKGLKNNILTYDYVKGLK